MQCKLEAGPNMQAGNALLTRLHYSVFVTGTYFLPVSEAGWLREGRFGEDTLLTELIHAHSPLPPILLEDFENGTFF